MGKEVAFEVMKMLNTVVTAVSNGYTNGDPSPLIPALRGRIRRIFVSLRPAWSLWRVPGKARVYIYTVRARLKKQHGQKENKENRC